MDNFSRIRRFRDTALCTEISFFVQKSFQFKNIHFGQFKSQWLCEFHYARYIPVWNRTLGIECVSFLWLFSIHSQKILQKKNSSKKAIKKSHQKKSSKKSSKQVVNKKSQSKKRSSSIKVVIKKSHQVKKKLSKNSSSNIQ